MILKSFPEEFVSRQSVEIQAPVDRSFELFSQFELLPAMTENVRRTKRIDERHVLFDLDIAGRQVVFEGL